MGTERNSHSRWIMVPAIVLVGWLGAPGQAQAVAVLTPTAELRGFSLSTFVDQVPIFGAVGPVGIVEVPGGMMVASYPGGIRIFTDADNHHWNDSANSAFYSPANAVDLVKLGSRYFMTQQSLGRVLEVDNTGATIATIATGIPMATGITGFGDRLFVTDCCSGQDIWTIDLTDNSKTIFKNFTFEVPDGMSISLDGTTLYVALGSANLVKGYRISDGLEVFSVGVTGGPDGTALGSGSLAGNLYVNTNNGRLVEVNSATGTQVDLVTGGSRGDFIHVDANNGTLLFTQTDRVLRLTAPSGGSFGNPVPEPSTWLLFGSGLAGLAYWRRKKTA